jgi:hypothetical protein
MIVFKFEVRLVCDVSAATATAAYKKLVESLPTQAVTQLDIKVLSQSEKKDE